MIPSHVPPTPRPGSLSVYVFKPWLLTSSPYYLICYFTSKYLTPKGNGEERIPETMHYYVKGQESPYQQGLLHRKYCYFTINKSKKKPF